MTNDSDILFSCFNALLVCIYYQEFVSSVQKGNVTACQFHPEKSGGVGLAVLGSFLAEHLEKRAPTLKFYGLCAPQLGERGGVNNSSSSSSSSSTKSNERNTGGLAKRVLACLDVRSNDDGDLVVTKGDQYDVREEAASEGSGGCDGGPESSSVIGADVQREGGNTGKVRNLGKPVALAQRYFEEGADEVVFLNITSFRDSVLEDTPMLAVLEQASETIFVPLTVGGGIRDLSSLREQLKARRASHRVRRRATAQHPRTLPRSRRRSTWLR